MTVHASPTAADVSVTRKPSRRTVALLASAIVLLLAVTGSGLAAGTTLFGPVAFVRVYLDALARGDAAGALSIPGVSSGAASPELLAAAGPSSIEVVAVREIGHDAGVHRIVVDWRIQEHDRRSILLVERIGTSGLLFPRWGFAVSPTATVVLEAVGDERIRVNEVTVRLSEPERFAVFVPGGYNVEHASRYLESRPVPVIAEEADTELSATVTAEANALFQEEVDRAAQRFLDGCSEQERLFPTACPFGHRIDDRITTTPAWTIVEFPELPIARDRSGWVAGPGEGTARLVVDVQDIADGEQRHLDEEIGFRLRLEIRLDDDDVLTITPDGALALR